jgi:hypothetical protein
MNDVDGSEQEAGIKGFWQGNGANVLKVAPETGIKFVTYEFVKRIFRGTCTCALCYMIFI